MLDIDLGADAATIGELYLGQVEMDAPFLPVAVQPVIAAVVHMRNPLLHDRDARETLLPLDARFDVAIAAPAIEEADLRIEVAPHLDDARDITPGAGLLAQPHAIRGRIAVGPGHSRRRPHQSTVHASRMPRRPSTPYTRLQSPVFPVAMRCTAMSPTRDRAASSRCRRSTE